MTFHKEDSYKKIALFYFAYRSLTEKPDQVAEKYGIQRVHHRILFFIAQIPGVSVNQLLTVLEVTKQSLNLPLRQLKDKGYIVTISPEEDKRIKQHYLTDSGKDLLKELSKVQIDQMEEIFSILGKDYEEKWTTVMEEYAKIRPGVKLLNFNLE
ncbi:MarR family transcriptional regulator [Bacillus sp. RG28]|uniref:MarR family transcriptional regulator n=1 Tax=Gottfriedia endophytica TaxID=2820819 RepID=A0A940SIF8_9BACI|nr:MarR family transcriptional regulator [Gottfriedia endophytica]MBP0724441.1 MarR family transcriptional regulator [Gottfriedia endophytica]